MKTLLDINRKNKQIIEVIGLFSGIEVEYVVVSALNVYKFSVYN